MRGGSTVNVDKTTLLGYRNTSSAEVTIDGPNSALNSKGETLIIGNDGKVTVNVQNSGQLTANVTSIGNNLLSTATLTATGEGTNINSKQLIVGYAGKGTLNINNKATVSTSNIGNEPNTTGTSTVNFDGGILKLLDGETDVFNNFNSTSSIDTITLKTNGGTIDILNNSVNLFNKAVIKGNGDFTKAGSGLLTMNTASKQWTGATNINQGTLRLDGDYTMRDGEVLGIGLNSLTDYGQLEVKGTADISKGTLKVKASDAVNALTESNDWKNVVTASTRTGEFKTVTDNNLLVEFRPDYSDPNAVHLRMISQAEADAKAEVKAKAEAEAKAKAEAEAKAKAEAEAKAKAEAEAKKDSNAFSKAVSSADNLSANSLAAVLDQNIDAQLDKTKPKNELALQLITDAEGLNQQQLAAAAAQLQPLFMGGANRLITDSNYAATDAISEHSQTSPERNLWAKAIGSDMTHDADGYVTGYNSENYGAIVGLDLPINPDLNLGLAVSYIESDADTDGHALNHELEAKNWQILGYGNYAAGEATNFNFHAGAGQSSVKGERHIQLKSNLTAKSDYDVDTLQAGFGVSHQLGSDTRNVSPFASFNYARAKSDGYSEKGAGAYNLTVDENTYESMRWTAGLRFNQALTPTVSLTGQLAGAIENGDSYSDITASFTDVGSNKFYTQGQESKEAIGIAGIGLAFKPTANTTISANYRGEWRDNYDDQGAALVFETKF